jgi:hypothetical protein
MSNVWHHSIQRSLLFHFRVRRLVMTSCLMNTGKMSSSLPESMQRMITPQYEQIVNEIEQIYHHPDKGVHCSV